MAAPGSIIIYGKNKDDIRLNDILAATVKLALVNSSYTPNATVTGHNLWVDASANEIVAGNGYTAGGIALTTPAVLALSGGYKFSSDNVLWNATPANIPAWRYGVLYLSGTVWGMINPLIGYFLGDSAPADYPATVAGNPLTINVPANGWFNIP
jgi:hypothetical protein